LDTPQALKAQVGRDRVQIETDDDDAAIAALRERFDVEATVAEGAVTSRRVILRPSPPGRRRTSQRPLLPW
jgi:hypothetical protein